MSPNSKTIKISSKGQITLPKSFLDNLGLSYGQNILIQYIDNKIYIINHRQLELSKIDSIIGSVSPSKKTNLTIDEQIEQSKKQHFKNKTSKYE